MHPSPRANTTKSLPVLMAIALLAACADEPQDQIIEIEDGYDESVANLEEVSLEAAEEQAEATPTNMEQ